MPCAREGGGGPHQAVPPAAAAAGRRPSARPKGRHVASGLTVPPPAHPPCHATACSRSVQRRRAPPCSYEDGLALQVWSSSGIVGLPSSFPPPGAALVLSQQLTTSACPRIADCFRDENGQAYTSSVAALVRWGRGEQAGSGEPAQGCGSGRRTLSSLTCPPPPAPRTPHRPQITGEVWTPADGVYSLYLTSRGDSRLYIDGSLTLNVADCDNGWRDGCLGKERSIEYWLAGERWHTLRCGGRHLPRRRGCVRPCRHDACRRLLACRSARALPRRTPPAGSSIGMAPTVWVAWCCSGRGPVSRSSECPQHT